VSASAVERPDTRMAPKWARAAQFYVCKFLLTKALERRPPLCIEGGPRAACSCALVYNYYYYSGAHITFWPPL